ncbi:MAG: methionyl-tRNA formyltransferase, partial [Bacteroidales bacterium]
MDKSEARIIFMGTPEFAVPSLVALIDNGFQVVGVITAPDRPSGRGKQLTQSAVKKCALDRGLHILQPENLKDPRFIEDLKKLKADLQIVVAFRMLPKDVWGMPPLGTFNLHASLLPHYRGAAPINHALINGETTTGVTTFLLDQEIDTGKILLQESVSISPGDDAGSLHDKLMAIGSHLVVKTAEAILMDAISPVSQTELETRVEGPKKAPKIFKSDCEINWQLSGEEIHNFVRGLSPYPAAISTIQKDNGDQISVKIFKTRFIQSKHHLTTGNIDIENKNNIRVAVKNGFIYLEE